MVPAFTWGESVESHKLPSLSIASRKAGFNVTVRWLRTGKFLNQDLL